MLRRFDILCILGFCLLLPARPTTAQSPPPESLATFATRMGFPPPRISGKNVLLESRFSSLSFEEESRKLVFNKVLIWMNMPLLKKDQTWLVSDSDKTATLMPLLKTTRYLRSDPILLVIDPGHGGDDTGAISRRKLVEKKLVLDISRRLAKQLQNSGMKTKLTREGDTTVPLSSRVKKAAEWKADLLVSIHLNSAPSRSASGIETYVLSLPGISSTVSSKADSQTYPGNRHDAANMSLAYFLQKGLISCTGAQDRGIKRARFDVLKNAPCPAALVECGFLSHPEEENKLVSSAYRDAVVDGLAQGIITWMDRTVVIPSTKP